MTMPHITPINPELLTDSDVEYANFSCCGDEDLVLLRCPACGHLSVQCYECETWYVDLADTGRIESAYLSDDERLACSQCAVPFEDACHLMEGVVDKYLPTAAQVIAAGYGRHLARHLREQHGVVPPAPDA